MLNRHQAHLFIGSLLPSSSRLSGLDAPLACLRYFMNSSVRLRVAPAAPLVAMAVPSGPSQGLAVVSPRDKAVG